MAKILDKSSVEYLRTDIEHAQLFDENKGEVTILTPADLLPDVMPSFPLRFHTTGNGVVYLAGRAVVQQAITAGTALFTVPERLRVNFTQAFAVSLFTSPTFAFLPLTITGNTISAGQDFGVLNDEIVLDGSFYLTG